MALKTATAVEITDAAVSTAIKDQQQNVTDPHGRWCNFINTNGLWNPSSAEEWKTCDIEKPLAHRMFITAYLMAQGWRKIG